MTATMPGIAVATVDPRRDPGWAALAATARGSLFTSPPWIRAVCDTYGFTPQARLMVDETGCPTDGFAWVPISDLRGDRAVSLPFSDRADPMVTVPARWPSLVADAVHSGAPLVLRCMDDVAAKLGGTLARAGEAAWHGTPLGLPVPELHRSLSSGARRNIAAAERSGVRVEAVSGIEGVRAYHRLHVSLRKRKYRLLAQPLALFEGIWREFSERDGVVTLLATVAGEPIAGAVYLVWNDTLYYKFGASLVENLALRPNDALAWTALQWASDRDLHLLDWGLSDLAQPGLIAYKRKWASVERRIVTLRTDAAADARSRPDAGEVLGALTALLTDDAVPDDVTERAGALLYRYFT